MRRLTAAFLCLIPGLVATPVSAAPERFELDPDHVSIGFLVGHAQFADVLGMFTDVEGAFVYDTETQTLVSGSVVVEADSVFTGHDRRDDHVRKEDFLYTDANPEIRFEATGYTPESADHGLLQGDLTVRGVTQPIELDLTLNRRDDHPIGGKDTLGGSARGSLLRSEFGMDYALEDEVVGDRVELIIEFEAIRNGR